MFGAQMRYVYVQQASLRKIVSLTHTHTHTHTHIHPSEIIWGAKNITVFNLDLTFKQC